MSTAQRKVQSGERGMACDTKSVEGRGGVESRVASCNIISTAPAVQNDTLTMSHAHLHVVTTQPDNAIQKTQDDTPKVLRLHCKMKMKLSKVLRLPRKMEIIFGKPCKSIAPVTQTDV